MKSRRHLIVVGVVVYLLALLPALPARHLYGWLGDNWKGTTLWGVGGTLWAGHALRANFGGLQLENLRWSFQPVGLVFGRLEYKMKFRDTQGSGKTRLGRGLFAGNYVRELALDSSAQRFNPAFPDWDLDLSGRLQADLETLKFRDSGPTDAAGSVTWTDAAIQAPFELPLGTLELQLSKGEDGITGNLSSPGGPHEIQADASLGNDWTYRVNGGIRPADSQASLGEVLSYLGRPDGEGRYQFSISGQLF